MGRRPDLMLGDLEFMFKFLHQLLCKGLFVREGHEGVHEPDVVFLQALHIVFDIFRVGGDDGAVVVVPGPGHLIPFIRDAGIENKGDALFYEPFHVAMGQLRRIAFGLAGNGLDAQLIDLAAGLGGQDHLEAQFLKEHSPEGEVLVHVQHPRDPHRAAEGLVGCQRLVIEDPVIFIGIKIRDIPFGFFNTQAPLAAVAGDILSSSLKAVDGQDTVVDAAAAPAHGGGVGKADDPVQRKHGGLLRVEVIPFPGDQRSAEGAHDPGNIRPDGVAAGDLFKAPQYGIVVEGAALYHHIFSQV